MLGDGLPSAVTMGSDKGDTSTSDILAGLTPLMEESLASYLRKLGNNDTFLYSWADAKEFPKADPMDVPSEVMER
jgi:hypothetical protein